MLVDAPCSGLGALRRRPEARWRKAESDLPALAELQRALLRSALAAVRPGGVVAYVTCSPVPAETRDVVAAVVGADPGVEILDAPAALADVPGTESAGPLFAQLWPHRHGTDAIFIALLRRPADQPQPASSSAKIKLLCDVCTRFPIRLSRDNPAQPSAQRPGPTCTQGRRTRRGYRAASPIR